MTEIGLEDPAWLLKSPISNVYVVKEFCTTLNRTSATQCSSLLKLGWLVFLQK